MPGQSEVNSSKGAVRESGKDDEFIAWAQSHGHVAEVDGVNIRIKQEWGGDVIVPPDASYELPRWRMPVIQFRD